MNDLEIRTSFHVAMLRRYHSSKNALVLDELGLMHGSCRADIAVINGRLLGFEIKSNDDSLRRLQGQIDAYNSVFDTVTIIVGTRHRRAVTKTVPPWWGIVVATESVKGKARFRIQRKAKPNPSISPFSVAQLLWRDEIVELLRQFGAPSSVLRFPRNILYRLLAWHLPVDELRRVVCRQLKSRKNWRCHLPPSEDGDLSRPTSTLLDCRSRQGV